tara:strand:+ start:377 stop:568 length:192 start_codon:yes stop_codon:yes gene_type:complete
MKCFEQKKRITKILKIPSGKYDYQYFLYDKYDGVQQYSEDEYQELITDGSKVKITDSIRDFIK